MQPKKGVAEVSPTSLRESAEPIYKGLHLLATADTITADPELLKDHVDPTIKD